MSEEPAVEKPLSSALLWFMATACGLSVANIYYNQPLLGDFASYFQAPAWLAGLVATAAQVGYGAGLLFFLPLGDLVDRRKLIVGLVAGCAASLVAATLAPSLPFLIVANLLVGACAINAQILIPLGADMVPAAQRGRLVGTLMGGLLCGILLARVIAGVVADHLGWRATYGLAAMAMIVLGIGLRAILPHRPPASPGLSYGELMRSLLGYVRTLPSLRSASLVSALSFGAFCAFWTALSFLLAEEFHRGAAEAGMFGVIGLLGALAAPWAGRLSDTRGTGFTIAASLVITAMGFAVMTGWVSMVGLIIGVLLMDLGVQSIQVAAQARVISLRPEARSRLNTVYMVARFGGGATGSTLAAFAWYLAKWPGVCAICLAAIGASLAVHFASERTTRAREAA